VGGVAALGIGDSDKGLVVRKFFWKRGFLRKGKETFWLTVMRKAYIMYIYENDNEDSNSSAERFFSIDPGCPVSGTADDYYPTGKSGGSIIAYRSRRDY
jgi:hypothetical protein